MIVVEGTRGIDFLFGIIIAVVCANWIAQFVHKDGVYESELDHDGNVFFLRTEAPNALQYKVAADVSLIQMLLSCVLMVVLPGRAPGSVRHHTRCHHAITVSMSPTAYH